MYFYKKEKIISDLFIKNGYFIGQTEDIDSKNQITRLIKRKLHKVIKKNISFDRLYTKIGKNNINDLRLFIYNEMNKDKKLHSNYFKIARNALYSLAGNELMMQTKINLSIQLPNDETSLLPIHSDVWQGDSPFEINLWIPLVDCNKTKSMFILPQQHYNYFLKVLKKKKPKTSDDIFRIVKKKLKWLNIKKNQFLIFNQCLPHGNVENLEKNTRWSMNCRFKTIFSPYGDKKIGEFFVPITERPMTRIALEYKDPFK